MYLQFQETGLLVLVCAIVVGNSSLSVFVRALVGVETTFMAIYGDLLLGVEPYTWFRATD